MEMNIYASKLYDELITTDKETANLIYEKYKKTANLFIYHIHNNSVATLYKVTWRRKDADAKRYSSRTEKERQA